MNNNLDIFVFSHKTPRIIPNNDAYKVVCLEKDIEKINGDFEKIVCDESKENIINLEHAYSEGARMHYIWKNIPLKKYIGTAHYRRYFDFMENIPNLDELFKTHDAILPKFDWGWYAIDYQYSCCHNVNDLKVVLEVIKEQFPEYYEEAEKTMKCDKFYPCNIFIMTSEMFDKYCEFVFGVLDGYNKKMGFKNDIDVFNHVVNDIQTYCNNKCGMLCSVYYQARIQAFLMERIGNIFYNKNIKNPYEVELVLTEVNFEEERNMFKIYEK
jgi:hypothetical protein